MDIYLFIFVYTMLTIEAIEINKEEETFTTKGDNNTVDSSPVFFERLIGKVVL